MYKSTLKEKLQERFGDKYLEFMNDLSNIKFTHKELSEKWNVAECTIGKWIETLGYCHTGTIKAKMRVAYRIAARVKRRQETAIQMLNIIKKNRGII
jgi:hypothetical protein